MGVTKSDKVSQQLRARQVQFHIQANCLSWT